MKTGTTTLPPGDYIIIDPMLIMDHEQWETLLEISDNFEGSSVCHDGEENEIVGYSVPSERSYQDNEGFNYYIESGIVGIVSAYEFEDEIGIGKEVYFDHDIECYKENGKIHFGNIIIDTEEAIDV